MKASAQDDVLCFISVLNVAQQLKRGVAGMSEIAAALQRWAGTADGGVAPEVKKVRGTPPPLSGASA